MMTDAGARAKARAVAGPVERLVRQAACVQRGGREGSTKVGSIWHGLAPAARGAQKR